MVKKQALRVSRLKQSKLKKKKLRKAVVVNLNLSQSNRNNSKISVSSGWWTRPSKTARQIDDYRCNYFSNEIGCYHLRACPMLVRLLSQQCCDLVHLARYSSRASGFLSNQDFLVMKGFITESRFCYQDFKQLSLQQ